MTIEKELQELVRIYAGNDKEKKLDKDTLLRLDRDLTRLINQQLLASGPDEEHITRHYRKLSLKFHPDRRTSFSPEILWIEQKLSEGGNNDACFKSLKASYEKLTNPNKFKEMTFADIRTKEDCKQWLEHLKNQAGTYTSRSLYESLIDLLDHSSGFFDDAGQIKTRGIRALVKSMPMIFATYGAFIFAEELLAVYGIYFILLKGGQYLEKSTSLELKQIGRTLQEISSISSTVTTTIMVRLLEMSFWISRQGLQMGLQIGSALLSPMVTVNPDHFETQADPQTTLCRDLILASQNQSEGIQFKTPELKVISAPLEVYKELNSQQFFVGWRTGNAKRVAVDAFLFKMRVLDESPEPLEIKLQVAQKALEVIKKDDAIYNSVTAKAVDRAAQVITLLKEREPEASDNEEEELKEEPNTETQLILI
ncbi:J domain-containing protein [Legionella shakespearei]|uniref:DnaJ domain protein n=1 Tax=Legionella shakespearei DSM 23087 TaxID=1122169 RepID=A0A0W0YM83_9GAMM|nr:J domain-containing protein [Legionella shakespearei]KTD57943.1 DnaJ domain protein [Legionella shakespearei DSM 23087]